MLELNQHFCIVFLFVCFSVETQKPASVCDPLINFFVVNFHLEHDGKSLSVNLTIVSEIVPLQDRQSLQHLTTSMVTKNFLQK